MMSADEILDYNRRRRDAAIALGVPMIARRDTIAPYRLRMTIRMKMKRRLQMLPAT